MIALCHCRCIAVLSPDTCHICIRCGNTAFCLLRVIPDQIVCILLQLLQIFLFRLCIKFLQHGKDHKSLIISRCLCCIIALRRSISPAFPVCLKLHPISVLINLKCIRSADHRCLYVIASRFCQSRKISPGFSRFTGLLYTSLINNLLILLPVHRKSILQICSRKIRIFEIIRCISL